MLITVRLVALCFVLLFSQTGATAQYVQAQLPLTQLPQEHAYQRTIRAYLGTLRQQDLALERKDFTAPPPSSDLDERYRLWLLTLHLPAVQAAALPPEAFTLPAIEASKGLVMPATPAESQMLAWLAGWDYPGNPYHGSRALKRRAFVLAAIDLLMLDYLYEHDPQGADRSDFLGGNLIWIGYTARNVQDVVPDEVRAALATGLKKQVLRLNRWGPRGAMTDMDLFAAVGLWYCSQALDDAEVKSVAEAYARRLFTDERFFHPAGYFVDVGCFDTSYNGISLYFATWAALASDWKFAREAVDRSYRLRAHLSLPEPDGPAFGPSHMSSRTSADPPHDQWNFPQRAYAAAQVTDEALYLAPLPSEEALRAAPGRLVQHFNSILAARPVTQAGPWKEMHWSGAFNFPYEHYRKGYCTRRLQLEKARSPLLKPLYAREERFVRDFGGAFLIARHDSYAAVIHTGPIKGWPHGLGGGMLSAFWTPPTGPVLLGRRRGMQGHVRDALEEWRTWPVHAVSGTRAGGEFFTSAAITRPEATCRVHDDDAEVRVGGAIPAGKDGPALDYQRRFLLRPAGLSVQTTVRSAGPGKIAELYETLPVFLHDGYRVKEAKTRIQFQVDDRWIDASPQAQADVRAIRVERFGGAVLLTFDRARVVRLAAQEWTDGFQTRATCRTLLVDLLGGTGQPRAVESAEVQYSLAPAAPLPPAK